MNVELCQECHRVSLLEKSLALQVQEVTCELQGTRFGGRPDALLYIPASVARTAVSSQHRQQSRAPHTRVTYSNVILDTAVQCSPPTHTQQCDGTADNDAVCRAHGRRTQAAGQRALCRSAICPLQDCCLSPCRGHFCLLSFCCNLSLRSWFLV